MNSKANSRERSNGIVSEATDQTTIIAQSFLRRFGSEVQNNLGAVANAIGLEVVYRATESYDGALLRVQGVPRGTVIINTNIREEARQRFTLAHEIAHFVLPNQRDLLTPCAQSSIERWASNIALAEHEANQFAAQILMPQIAIQDHLRLEPSFASAMAIAQRCGTSLTASGYRLVSLTSFPAALVWSEQGQVRWYKASDEFGRWIRRGSLSTATYAADCFVGKPVPEKLEPVPAEAWLFEKGLRSGSRIWEHSRALPRYRSVLSLLVQREPVVEADEGQPLVEELDPQEFTIGRRNWPSKR
jgi:Zn-dependent peptidase ImmA (M78 family)